MTAPREPHRPPAPPDRRPSPRGGHPSSQTASAATRPAGLGRLAGTRRGLVHSVRTLAAAALLALVGALALPAAAQAQTPGICDRTQQVQDAILGALSVDDCAAVTDADLASLTSLDMSFQNIASLKSGDFAGLTRLTALGLVGNSFTMLPADVFSGLTALTELELSFNALASLPGTVFSSLTALTNLRLNGNDLSLLPGTVFSSLTSLTSLDLSNNDLNVLPVGLLSGLTALTSLRLSNNALNALPDGLFSGLTALETLSLSGNPTDPLPFTVTVEKVGTNQVRAKVLAGAPFAVDIPVTLVDGTLAGSVTALSVTLGSVDGAPVTVTRTAGTTAAVTVDVDLSTPPTLPRGHTGYAFAKATTGLPATILPDATTCTLNTDDRWCGVVTVGTYSNGVGFTDSDGALTDNTGDQTIAIASGNYTVSSVVVLASPAGALVMGLDTRFPTGDETSLVFHIGSSTFEVSEATFDTGVGGYIWQNSGLSWSVGDMVDVRLRRTTGGAVVPVVTIAADKAIVWDFDGTAGFTLSRTGSTAETLTVTVAVTQQVDRDLLPDGAETERTVTFAVNSATTALTVALENDDLAELPGELTVEVQAGSGYTVGDPALATVTVRDSSDARPKPANLMAAAGAVAGEVALSWDAYAPHLLFSRHQYRYKTDGDYPETWIDIPNSGQHDTGAGDGSNLTGYTVTGLVGGQSHTFQVRTYNSSSSASDPSDEATATPRSAAVTPTPGICDRTQQVHEAIVAALSGVDDCAAVTVADLAGITDLELISKNIDSLKSGDFAGLTSLITLGLVRNSLTMLPADVFSGLTALGSLGLTDNDLESLPADVFSGLTSLTNIALSNNNLNALPDGLFTGLPALVTLYLHDNSTNPLPLTVTVEKVGTDQVRAKVLTGAPFAVDIPVTVVDGTLAAGATMLRVAAGAVEGTAVTVTRTAGTTAAVTVDVDLSTQPTKPSGSHRGYAFARASSGLPATILPDETPTIPPGLEVTLQLSHDRILEFPSPVTVTATVSPASPVAFTVTISATPVAPATADDFTLSTNRVLRFAADATESTGTVTIRPFDDDIPEPHDVVRVSGAVSNAAIEDPDDVTVEIINNDPEDYDVEVSAPPAVDEGAGAAVVTLTLTTQKNTAPVATVEMYFYVEGGTATRGDDYTPPPGRDFGITGRRALRLRAARGVLSQRRRHGLGGGAFLHDRHHRRPGSRGGRDHRVHGQVQ